MKRLILHPEDRSTDFLKPIYSNLENTTVVTGGIRYQRDIHGLIESHDQVIMLGHGFSDGLLSVRQFGLNPFIIDSRCAKYLSEKESNFGTQTIHASAPHGVYRAGHHAMVLV